MANCKVRRFGEWLNNKNVYKNQFLNFKFVIKLELQTHCYNVHKTEKENLKATNEGLK